MKLSIIIPVYKVENYIYKCLESIKEQYLENYNLEVILINDGSPDNSVEVIKPLLKEMPYARLINQKNQGLSASRNKGINNSTGEYIWFIDSDDWILPNALSDVFKALNNNPKITLISTILEVNEEQKVYQEYNPNTNITSGKEYLKKRYRQGAAQRFIIRKDFLIKNNLYFYPGILHEDGLFGYKLLYLADRIMILPKPIYAYRIRTSGSIMSSISMKTPIDMLFIHKELIKFTESNVSKEDQIWYRICIFNILIDLFSFSKRIISTKDFKDFYENNKRYFKKESIYVLSKGKRFLKCLQILLIPIFYWKIYNYIKPIKK